MSRQSDLAPMSLTTTALPDNSGWAKDGAQAVNVGRPVLYNGGKFERCEWHPPAKTLNVSIELPMRFVRV